MKPMQFRALTVGLLFIATISLPIVLMLASASRPVGTAEKRRLARMPTAPQSVAELERYPDAVEKYLNDHFGLRSTLILVHNRIKYWLGDSPSRRVVIGKDDWLFYGSKGGGDVLSDARNLSRFSPAGLRQHAKVLERRRRWLERLGAAYVVIVAPNKHSVYSEYLPSFVSKIGDESVTDQYLRYMRRHTRVPILDPRERLIAAKRLAPVYYRYDTHWNSFGANIAHCQVTEFLNTRFGDVFPKSCFGKADFVNRVVRGGALARMIGVQNLVSETELIPGPALNEKLTCPKQILKSGRRPVFAIKCGSGEWQAIVFRDSFFIRLEPYISRLFAKVTYIRGSMSTAKVRMYLEEGVSTLVIEEFVERRLPFVPKFRPD